MIRVQWLLLIILSIAQSIKHRLLKVLISLYIQLLNTYQVIMMFLAGVVVTSNQEFYDKLYYNLNTTGPTLSPFDSYMLMRGLKTLKLRMEASTANAQEVVAFLEKSPAVKEILYPGKGGTISFKVADQDKIQPLSNSLKVFTFAESLGGVESDYLPNDTNPRRYSR